MTGLHAELRRRTGDLHATLNASLPLVAGTLTRASYAAFLSRLLAWLQPVEDELAGRLPAGDLQLPLLHRARWLAGDLRALGVLLPNRAPTQVLPALESPAHAVGCWYVVEGSALGGQVISRRLEDTLGITRDCGGRYFAGIGSATGIRWRTVCAALGRYDGETAEVVEGARRAFHSLQAWLA